MLTTLSRVEVTLVAFLAFLVSLLPQGDQLWLVLKDSWIPLIVAVFRVCLPHILTCKPQNALLPSAGHTDHIQYKIPGSKAPDILCPDCFKAFGRCLWSRRRLVLFDMIIMLPGAYISVSGLAYLSQP